jgi:hypothetical protein
MEKMDCFCQNYLFFIHVIFCFFCKKILFYLRVFINFKTPHKYTKKKIKKKIKKVEKKENMKNAYKIAKDCLMRIKI